MAGAGGFGANPFINRTKKNTAGITTASQGGASGSAAINPTTAKQDGAKAWDAALKASMETKKTKVAKNTHPCHSGRISCIAQPSTMQIPTE